MSNLRDGYQAVCGAMARGLEPDPNLPVDVWADRYMVIPKSTGSNEAGPYRTARTPHAREVMRCLSDDHPCKRVVAKVASQMFKTQVGMNWFACSVHQSPSNFLWLVPTGKLHKRAAARIDKTIAAVPELRERVARRMSRDSNNNNDIKEYVGGALYIATAGAAANLSELSVRRVLYDEIDRSKDNVGGEGDPAELAEARQTTFERNRKSYYPSSPTIEGESPVDALYLRGTQREALAECIHCGHAQPLEFDNLVRSDDGKRAMYPCCECGGLHEEGDKTRMFAKGLWSDGHAGDGETESFTASAMFLPYGWIPWVSLMRQYDMAKAKLEEGSEEAMIVFYNTRLARCWARSKETTRYDELQQRAEDYRLGTVPAGGLVLTAAIDTQAYRLELKVVAWGEGMEAWIVDYQVIHGSPAEADTWAKADELLRGRYRHASGHLLGISAAFVDSGGSNTQDVYNYTAPLRRRNVFAVKGHSRPNRPILSGKPTLVDLNLRGKTAKKGAELWLVGPDTAKDYLQARWKRASGPGAVHFSIDLPESYFKGVTAEYRTYGYKRGRKVSWWEQKKGDPNEPLDLMVYNLGAAYKLGLHKKTEHGWQLLRDAYTPQQGSLLDAPLADTPATPGDQAPPPPVVAERRLTAVLPPPPLPPVPGGGRVSLEGLARFNKTTPATSRRGAR
jgi:phage terminase large subunit GpA-like protein